MGSDHIGEWTARFGPRAGPNATVPVADQKWHRVESEIADRKVVKCGKELKSQTTTGSLRFSDEPPAVFLTCLNC